FARTNRAVAAVEFALVLPLMLTMYLGSTELSQLINIDQRVTVIAGTIGDLVSREKNTLPAGDLTDFFQAATAILNPFPTASLNQTVTLLSIDSTGKITVKWSQGTTGAWTLPTGALTVTNFVSPDIVSLVEGAAAPYVVVSEASYTYTPLLGLFFTKPFTLYHKGYYLPRYPAIICYPTSPCS